MNHRPAWCATLGVVAILATVGLAGCGESSSEAVRRVARAYATAIHNGDGSAACALLTSRTQAEMNKYLVLEQRYSDTDSGSCQGFMANEVGSTPLGHIRAVAVHADEASVWFDGPYRNDFLEPVKLAKVASQWRATFTTNSSATHVAESSDASQACISAWNRAVQSGAVQLPKLTTLAAQEIWADMFPFADSGGGSCNMSLNGPTAEGGYLYDEQADGSWTETTGYSTKGKGRSVWLDSKGVATPASRASPDGMVPALGGAGSGTNTTAQEPPQTPSQPEAPRAPSAPMGRRKETNLLAALANSNHTCGFDTGSDYLSSVRVTSTGWAAGQIHARDDSQQGNCDIIFRKSGGTWRAFTYGSEFVGSAIPASVLAELGQ